MARREQKRSLRPASCCSVEVMNGAAGERRNGFSVMERTAKGTPSSPAARARARASSRTTTEPGCLSAPDSSKSRPEARGTSSSAASAARNVLGDVSSARRRSPFLFCDGEGGVDPPPAGRAEADARPLALDHHAGGHALDPAGGQPGHDLLPQHGRDLVAVEPVEDATGLLGVDQPTVEVTPLAHGPLDGRPGDLVEDHALDRDGGGQDLEQVPGDGLALAVLVGGQVDLAGLLDQLLQLGHLGLLLGRDHVERLEAVVHVDAQAAPRLVLVGGRDLVGSPGQVPDVADGGLDHVVGPEQAGDRLGLGRRFHDDQRLCPGPGARRLPRGRALGPVGGAVGRCLCQVGGWPWLRARVNGAAPTLSTPPRRGQAENSRSAGLSSAVDRVESGPRVVSGRVERLRPVTPVQRPPLRRRGPGRRPRPPAARRPWPRSCAWRRRWRRAGPPGPPRRWPGGPRCGAAG